MTHLSTLALFDYVAGKSDLTAQETEHLQECDDCRGEAVELRRVSQDSTDIDRTRRQLAEEAAFELETESPAELHQDMAEKVL